MAENLKVGDGASQRTIAVEVRPGTGATQDRPIVWLGGFRSDMRGSKAERIDALAARTGHPYVRFDYAGHGESGGRFEDCTISTWLEDARAVIAAHVHARPLLVGSSMGGWIALLLARALAGTAQAPAGLVLIAPAADFTQKLMWDAFPEAIRTEILDRGVHHLPSDYGDPYPITRALIEDGRRHLLLDGAIETGCPVHILQGMRDPDVPWRHALETLEHIATDSVTLTLVKDGDHRLSRDDDLALLERTVAAMLEDAFCS